uniref:DUF4283 domain-containing protein n=1 Tax=Brassica campestris TaxID=3711 RepID=M4DEG8_BRACM
MGVPPPDPDPPPRSSVVPQFGSFALGSIPFQSSSLPVSDSARNGASPSFDSFVDKASLTGAQSVHLSDQGAAVQNQAPVSFQGVSSSSKLPVQDSSDSGLNPTGTVPVKEGTSGNLKASSSSSNEEFNWAKNLSSASKFPISEAPVSTSSEGRPRVKVANGVFERGATLHKEFIVGIFYGKAPSYGKIWGVLNYLWGKDRRVTVHHLVKNTYIFHIPSPSLRRRILQHELWRVGDSPFFVTEWKAEFSFNPPSLDRAPVWAKINGIPFDLITYKGLSCVCTPLGRVVDSKPFTSISSAEVKVIVDLTKPLPSEMELECEDGRVLILEVTYPWLPPLCPLCNEIGHKAAFCPEALAKEKQSFDKPKGNAKEEWHQVHSKKKKRKGKSTVVDGNVVKPVGTPPPAQREGKQIMASTSENHVSSDRQAQLSDHAVDLTLLGTARGEFASPPKHSSDPASSSMAIDAVVSPPKHSSDPASSSMAIDAVVISKGSKSQFETSNSPVLDIVIANPHNSMVALLSSGSSSPSNRKKKKRKYGSLQSPVTRDILPLEWKNNHHLN